MHEMTVTIKVPEREYVPEIVERLRERLLQLEGEGYVSRFWYDEDSLAIYEGDDDEDENYQDACYDEADDEDFEGIELAIL